MGDKSLTAKEGGLTRTMKSSFSDLCIKYDDIRNVDRMAAVQASRVHLSLYVCTVRAWRILQTHVVLVSMLRPPVEQSG